MSMTKHLFPILAAALAAVTACGESAGTLPSVDASERSFPFEEGDFQFTTVLVEDGCGDGALNLLFMPNGTDTPWDWEFPIRIFPPERLPQSYAVPLREPFGQMQVNVEPVSAVEERIRGAENRNIRLGEAQFGACVADMDADVDLTLLDSNTMSGHGALSMTNPRGDGRCPTFPAECSVLLTIEAVRVP